MIHGVDPKVGEGLDFSKGRMNEHQTILQFSGSEPEIAVRPDPDSRILDGLDHVLERLSSPSLPMEGTDLLERRFRGTSWR
jgi:hypothetical protein